MPQQFVHLRFHSEYSITDGIVRLDPAIDAAIADGQVALGLTDSMNVFGALRFYSHAIAKGLKPVIGCDLWIRNEDRRDQPYRLTLYCQNHDGYLTLCDLLSRGWTENNYLGRGEVSFEWLNEGNAKGLICLTGGHDGIIERHMLEGKSDQARQYATHLKRLFDDRLYIEVQRAGHERAMELSRTMARLGAEMGIPVVATHPIEFLKPEEFTAHDVRCCIASGHVLADPRRPRLFTQEQYFKSVDEMVELFSDMPQALANTLAVAQRCNLDGVLQKPQLPDFPTPDGMSLDDYMIQLSHEGLEKRLEFLYPDPAERDARRPDYVRQLDYELKTICGMKFPGYFLIVQDFINWSKRNGVPVGPGRGSGAGSLVAYALGITDLDPLHYSLIFERFLNPERVSMPDFDVDFCQFNRDRTIEYVRRTYGKEAVSQIVTFGAMGAKAVVRDVGRVLNMGYGQVDKIAKLIPQLPGQEITLAKAEEMVPEFKELVGNPEYKELMDYARSLEGITRNLGMHAGGVLIAPGQLTNFCPLYNADGAPENTVSQYDKKDIENVGLVKFDFLGLTTLTILTKAVEYIDHLHPGTHFELERIPVRDEKTLDIFRKANTGAVFQFESEGMRQQLKEAQPSCLEDLVALNALYRPGPMDQIPHFIERKFGREKVEYLHECMEPVLRETYGIMVYQEQVMQVAREVAGYSLGGADLLRRAMGKKQFDVMKKQREIFVKGAYERHGISEKTACEIFDLMEKFAGYGFNKSHAAAYSFVAWQTAYIKAHYPAAFFAGNICLVLDQGEKIRALIDDAREMHIRVLAPDVNASEWYPTVPDEGTMRMGLGSLKGVGQNIVEEMLIERLRSGPFLDLFDVAARVPSMNRKVLEQMIRGGAFDSLDKDRGKLFANVEQALKAAQTLAQSAGQGSLFGDDMGQAERLVSWLMKYEKWDDSRKFAEEKIAYGFYLTGNPVDIYRKEFSAFSTPFARLRPNQTATLGVLVVEATKKQGKNGPFAVLSVTDGNDSRELMAYSEVYDRFRQVMFENEVLVVTVRARVNAKTERVGYQIQDVKTLPDYRRHRRVRFELTVDSSVNWSELEQLLRESSTDEGGVPLAVELVSNGIRGVIDSDLRVSPCDHLVQAAAALDGVISADYKYA